MRAFTWILLGTMLAGTAFAGPHVPKSMVGSVPTEVSAKGGTFSAEVTAHRAKADSLGAAAASARTSIKTQKLEIKALEAEIAAEKARWKVAKKAKDTTAMSTTEAKKKELEAQLDAAETKLGLTALEADLWDAEADLEDATADLKEADVQWAYATALLDAEHDIDPTKFAQARAKAELTYQQARETVAAAEAKYIAKGGAPSDSSRDDVMARLTEGGRYPKPPPPPAPPAPVAPPEWTQPAPATP